MSSKSREGMYASLNQISHVESHQNITSRIKSLHRSRIQSSNPERFTEDTKVRCQAKSGRSPLDAKPKESRLPWESKSVKRRFC